jgi:hypothetical protein
LQLLGAEEGGEEDVDTAEVVDTEEVVVVVVDMEVVVGDVNVALLKAKDLMQRKLI